MAVLALALGLSAGLVHAQANQPISAEAEVPLLPVGEAAPSAIPRAPQAPVGVRTAPEQPSPPLPPAEASATDTEDTHRAALEAYLKERADHRLRQRREELPLTVPPSAVAGLPENAPAAPEVSPAGGAGMAPPAAPASSASRPAPGPIVGPAQLPSAAEAEATISLGLPPRGPDGSEPAEASSGSAGSTVLTTLAALAVVVGLIFALRAVVAKVSGQPLAAGRSACLEVLARVGVAPRSHVLLIRVGSRLLVVGESGQGLSRLAEIDQPEEVADLLQQVTASRPDSLSQSFAHLLRGADRHLDERGGSPRLSREEGADTAEFSVDKARDQLSSLMSRLKHLKRGKTA